MPKVLQVTFKTALLRIGNRKRCRVGFTFNSLRLNPNKSMEMIINRKGQSRPAKMDMERVSLMSARQ